MEIVTTSGAQDPNKRRFDIAERKGRGHPDSIADHLAYEFSLRYSQWCEDRVGRILNHWVDKTTCVGARARVGYGEVDIVDPIRILLIGKITRTFGKVDVPLERLLHDAVQEVFETVLTREAQDHYSIEILNTAGIAVDHDHSFYEPGPNDDNEAIRRGIVANDTMLAVGHSSRSYLLDLAETIETSFSNSHEAVGTDVKLMLTRSGNTVNVVAAVPVIPERVRNRNDYLTVLQVAEASTREALRPQLDKSSLKLGHLQINTKDRHGGAYLAPFGSSLGKGDVGAVGRGNRTFGGIEPYSSWTAEAPAGKNPLSHGGRIYPRVCTAIARYLGGELGQYVDVGIHARNGDDLHDPALVIVRLSDQDGAAPAHIRALVEEAVRTMTAEHIDPERYGSRNSADELPA